MLRTMMNKTKEEWIQEQCNFIYEDMSRKRSNKRAYKTLIMLIRIKMIFFDKNDKLLADNNGLMRRWTYYCNNYYK